MMTQATKRSWDPEAPASPTPEEATLVMHNWKKMVGGKYKGHLYGLGTFSLYIQTGVDHIVTNKASTSRPPPPQSANEVIELRDRVQA